VEKSGALDKIIKLRIITLVEIAPSRCNAEPMDWQSDGGGGNSTRSHNWVYESGREESNSAEQHRRVFLSKTGLDKDAKSAIMNNAVNEGLEKLMEVMETNRR
jgi:hypothetical protein